MVKNVQNGLTLHEEALKLREQGNLAASIAKARESQFIFLAAGDKAGAAESAACEAISWRVAANQSEDATLLDQGISVMTRGVQLARESGDLSAVTLPLYQLAELQEDLGDYEVALHSYEEAIQIMQTHPPLSHNRPSVLADMRVHMAGCEYKATHDPAALAKLQTALAELEAAHEPDAFTRHVWESGGYLRLAELLRDEDREEAKRYLERAREIIDADDTLVLRKQQWEKLHATFVQ